jgi:hypothetical protein
MAVTLDQIKAELAQLQTALNQLIADVNSLSPTPAPPPTPTPSPTGESAEGTLVTDTKGQIIDAKGDKWTLVNSQNNGMQIARNGNVDSVTALVTMMLYHGHTVYQTSPNPSTISTPGWWSWSGSQWQDAQPQGGTPAPPPGPTPTPAPPPAAGVIQINLGTPSPASQGVTYISPYVFGAGSEGLGQPGVNTYYAAVNSGWQNTYKQQNWRLFRFNTEATANDWINNSTARQNFTNGFKTFWQNENYPATPYVGNRFVFTVGSASPDPFGPSQCVQIANYFKSIGMECFFWEIWNEPDAAMGGAWNSNFVACRNALKQVNPNYMVGGPTNTYPSVGTFNQAAQAGADFASFHWYLHGSPGSVNGMQLYQAALSNGANHVGLVQQSGFGTNKPIFLGEWSITWQSGGDPNDQTIDGALFINNYMYGAMTQANSKVEMSAIWTIGENTSFTFVNNDGSNVRPRGHLLGKLGRTMGGPRVQCQVGSGLSNILAMAMYDGNHWAVWLTNYNTSGSQTVNVQGLTGSSYTYWELSANHPQPITQTNQASSLSNLSLPSRSVVVLSNF